MNFDRVLLSDQHPRPSAQFTANVMAAVRQAASEPAPSHFPWLRFATGVAACGVMAAAGASLATPAHLSPLIVPMVKAAPQLGYAAAASAASLLIAALPRLISALRT